MGLDRGSKSLAFEERWANYTIEKDLTGNNAVLRIRSVVGYYMDKGLPSEQWITTSEEYTHVSGDHFTIVSGLSAALLLSEYVPPAGATKDQQIAAWKALAGVNMGTMLEKAVYGILGGQVRLDATVAFLVQDAAGAPVPEAHMTMTAASGMVIYDGPAVSPVTVTAALGVRVDLTAPGYQLSTFTLPVVQGNVGKTVVLSPVAAG